MKNLITKKAELCLVLSLLSAGAGLVQADSRVSNDELIARREVVRERLAKFAPEHKVEDQVHPSQYSILDESVLLSSGREWTFVPKGAVLHIPENFGDRVNVEAPAGKFVPFSKFIVSNRGWVSSLSVTLDQARGIDVISEKTREALSQSGRVVVTVCKGGPITTAPPKAPVVAAKN